MSKKLALRAKIELKSPESDVWTDVSDHVSAFRLEGVIGNIYVVRLTFVDKDDEYIHFNSHDDLLTVCGMNVANHVFRYERRFTSNANEEYDQEVICIYFQADSDVLRINGVHPWDEPRST